MDTIVRSKPKPVRVVRVKVRAKRNERKSLVKSLDALCRSVVLERDGACFCLPPSNGHSSVRQAGHLITRSKESVRWDLWNVNEQCSGCNMLHEFNPHRYVRAFIERFGPDQYALLCERSEKVSKLQVYELREMVEQFQKIYDLQLADKSFKPYFTQQQIVSGAWAKHCEENIK